MRPFPRVCVHVRHMPNTIAHFQEENEHIPLIREHMTQKEMAALVGVMRKGHGPLAIGVLYRDMPMQKKREWAKYDGPPFLVQKFLLMPKARTFENMYTKMLVEITDEVKYADHGTSGCMDYFCG